MSMHQGIDLSRFRKVSSDGKTTTLRHAKGHEIKVAHGALTDKMRDKINEMPIHLADGDAVAPAIPAPDDSASETPSEPGIAVQPEQPAPNPGQKTTADIANEMNAHDLEYQQMLAKGTFQPKTYSDLYAKQDTLGKVGTLFGLLVSGAGSGLSHQPNAVMEMMNKELANDLEAQKQSKTNTENWYKMHMQHELNNAQQGLLGAQTEGAKAANIASIAATEKSRAQAKFIPGIDQSTSGAALKNYADNLQSNGYPDLAAKNTMSSTAIQHLQDIVNRMPPGTSRDAAQKTLDQQIRPAADAQIIQNNQKKAVIKKDAMDKALSSSGQQNSIESPVIDNDKFSKALAAGSVNEKNGIPWQPGTIDPNDKKDLISESGRLKKFHNLYKSWNEDFYKLRDLSHAGQVPGGITGALSALAGGAGTYFGGPAVGATLAGGVASAGSGATLAFTRRRTKMVDNLKERLAGVGISGDRANDLINSIVPAWNDFTEQDIKETYHQGAQHFKDVEPDIAPTWDFYNSQISGLKNELPEFPYKEREPEKREETSQPIKNENQKVDSKKDEEPKKSKYKPIMNGWGPNKND